MTIVNANDPLNPHTFIDTDHPERGLFAARPDMDEKAVEAEWDTLLNPQPGQAAAEANEALRGERDRLLKESDWTQLPDAPIDQKRWAIYRQQLRDMNFDKPEWPEQPGKDMTPDDTLRVEKHLDRAARTILFDGKNKS